MWSRVQGSQIFKWNSIISFYSKVIVILPIWVSSALGEGGVGQVGGGYLGWTTIVYMSSGVFRGKESSNRIKLSRLNFGVFGSLQLWGWGWVDLGVGWLAVPPTHMHMHMPAHTCTHTHIHVKHNNFNCKWQPPLGESLGIPFDVICAHVCVYMHVCACMCMCGGGHPFTTPTPIHPPPTPGGEPHNQSKFNRTWTNQDISIWNLWRLPHPWMGV